MKPVTAHNLPVTSVELSVLFHLLNNASNYDEAKKRALACDDMASENFQQAFTSVFKRIMRLEQGS